jgi:phage terminase large subunit-like protein
LTDFYRQLKEKRNRLQELLERDKAVLYRPYPKQREFHNLLIQQRLISAGNQLGKTLAGAAEATFHLTGVYPAWWKGKQFKHPIRMWVGGVSGELIRDGSQRKLLGDPEGTGLIPAHRLIKTTPSRGVAGLRDTGYVRWGTNPKDFSTFTFKSYEQGEMKWQTETTHVIWLDEEPPEEIFNECMARISAAKGILYMTFTPLLGMTGVVRAFFEGGNPQRAIVMMGIEDVEHFTDEERAIVAANYPEHEREARLHGIPKLGSGAVFPIAEERIKVPAFEVPVHWAQLVAMDFGISHPTAIVRLAHDTENDIVYVIDAWRLSNVDVAIVSDSITSRIEREIPVAYPHDGDNREKGSGETLAQLYRQKGVNMLPESVRFEDGGRSVEVGISIMLNRMNSGRFKVFSHLVDWFSEYRQYHRKDGVIHKEFEDLMSATRYGIMGLRYATKLSVLAKRRKDAYDMAPKRQKTWKTY